MKRKLKIFLLGSHGHPEELAAMGAEKDIIEQDERFEAVNPGDFPVTWKGVTKERGRQIDFRHDAQAMLECDGVLLMEPASALTGDAHLLYFVATTGGMPVRGNTGDLMNELLRNRDTLFSFVATPANTPPLKVIGYVHENTVPALEMGVVCSAVIVPVPKAGDKRIPVELSKYPVAIYAKQG